MTSDLEEAAELEQRNENAAEMVLLQMGNMIRQADETLDGLERDDVLGSAIYRGCQDLADAVGNLARNVDGQSPSERIALARACVEDAEQSLLLHEEMKATAQTPQQQELLMRASPQIEQYAQLSENQMMDAINVAVSLLREIECALRSIQMEEAEEVADVALTVARLFIVSLQSVHESLVPEDLVPRSQSRSLEPARNIEMLDESGQATQETVPESEKQKKRRRIERLRVLWPPMGPAVSSALQWGKEEAVKQPILAVAVGIALWPAAVVGAFVGVPVVLADGFVQDIYNHFEDAPIIQGVERSAAQVFHTGRLYLVCGKIVGRQVVRVSSRQIERHGGVGQIAQNMGHLAVDRILHPVESIGMAWNGVGWIVGNVRETFERLRNEDERDSTVQDLQQ